MLRDRRVPVAPAPRKWPSAPLFGKGWCAPEADGSARAKSAVHSEVTAEVSVGVASPWDSFRVADHTFWIVVFNARR
jgi:hypothetical protein